MTETPSSPSDEQDDFVREVHEHPAAQGGPPTPRIGEQADASTEQALGSEREAVGDDFEPGSPPSDS